MDAMTQRVITGPDQSRQFPGNGAGGTSQLWRVSAFGPRKQSFTASSIALQHLKARVISDGLEEWVRQKPLDGPPSGICEIGVETPLALRRIRTHVQEPG